MPAVNPFRAVELTQGKDTTKPASRAEAYALHRALLAGGEPHLAAVRVICVEWHQRPENVVAGRLTWRTIGQPPRGRTQSSRCITRPVRKSCLLPPELASRSFPNSQSTSTLERLGVPIVLMQPKPQGEQIPGPAKPSCCAPRVREFAERPRRRACPTGQR